MNRLITVTGGNGFIGANLVAHLNSLGITPSILTRNPGDLGDKWRNLAGLQYRLVDRLPSGSDIVHLGANVDTTERMSKGLWANNTEYTLSLQRHAEEEGAQFIYASSASVYGASIDFTERTKGLVPLNAYAQTKLYIDQMLDGKPHTYGLRFFNVYGPREHHKGKMASLVHKALAKKAPLYRSEGPHKDGIPFWTLFKHPTIESADIKRDLVYVGDVVKVICHFLENSIQPGIFNLGTGRATSFESVVKAVEDCPIEYSGMPYDMVEGYQRFSQADLTRLREVARYKAEFLTVEEGIKLMKSNQS